VDSKRKRQEVDADARVPEEYSDVGEGASPVSVAIPNRYANHDFCLPAHVIEVVNNWQAKVLGSSNCELTLPSDTFAYLLIFR
jgi:hypothetical protein